MLLKNISKLLQVSGFHIEESTVVEPKDRTEYVGSTMYLTKEDSTANVLLQLTSTVLSWTMRPVEGEDAFAGYLLLSELDESRNIASIFKEIMFEGQKTNPVEESEFVTVPEGTITINNTEYLVPEFKMCNTCVTNKQWKEYVDATGQGESALSDDPDKLYHPVVNVTKVDIDRYIAWLNKTTGENYSLPYEVEWEYAARGGTKSSYYTGEDIITTQANFRGDKGDSIGKTTPVGTYPANQYGIYDLHGNVWEVMTDYWSSDIQIPKHIKPVDKSSKAK